MCVHLMAVCSRCGEVTNPGYHLVKPCEMIAREIGTRDLMASDDLGPYRLAASFCPAALRATLPLRSVFVPTPPCRNPQCAALPQEQLQHQIFGLTIPDVLNSEQFQLRRILSDQDIQTLMERAWNAGWQDGNRWAAEQLMAGNYVGFQGVQLGPLSQNLQPNLAPVVGPNPTVEETPASEEAPIAGHPFAGNQVLSGNSASVVGQGPRPDQLGPGNLDSNENGGYQSAAHNRHPVGTQAGPSTQPQTRPRPWTPREDQRLLQLNDRGLSDKEILDRYGDEFPGRTLNALETRRSRLNRKKSQQARPGSTNAGCKPGNTNPRRDPDSDPDADTDPSTGFGAADSVDQTMVC